MGREEPPKTNEAPKKPTANERLEGLLDLVAEGGFRVRLSKEDAERVRKEDARRGPLVPEGVKKAVKKVAKGLFGKK